MKWHCGIENTGMQYLFWLYLYIYPHTDHTCDFDTPRYCTFNKLPLYGEQYHKTYQVVHHWKGILFILCYMMHHVLEINFIVHCSLCLDVLYIGYSTAHRCTQMITINALLDNVLHLFYYSCAMMLIPNSDIYISL